MLSSGDFYRRQRRLVRPSFHRDRIARYAETMIDLATATANPWRPGQIVALDERMHDLALDIYGHSFNYAPNAEEFYLTVARWADRMVGR